MRLHFFISNWDQTSALKVAYIFKVFRAQSCLMVAQQFDHAIYVCEEQNNFQNSRSIYLIKNFKVFQIMLLRQLNFAVLSIQQLFYVYCKGQTPLFLNLQFLLLLNERRLRPESCLVSCHPRAQLLINRLLLKRCISIN